jgi:carotenoid cleavage dioxygenase-like enzyme
MNTTGHAQEVDADPMFFMHHANAFDEGDETVLWSSAWGPDHVARMVERRKQLGYDDQNGILGAWDDILQGDYTDVPVTSLFEHRINRKTGACSISALQQPLLRLLARW